VAHKTVGKWLSIDQRDDYQAWVDNDRRAHELLARLEAIGVSALRRQRPRSRCPLTAPSMTALLPWAVDKPW
jgi:hypothetical protein